MTQNNELDLILDDLVVVGADIIGVGERIDKLYEGERTLYKHFLFSENELLAFLKLRDTRAESPISQNEQQEAVSTLEDWLTINMPSGTVIGDPLWWARKIRNVLALTEAPKQIPDGWISVEDRLPDFEKEYLVYGNCTNDGYKPDIAYFMHGVFEKFNQPSHWMPLPQSPNTENVE